MVGVSRGREGAVFPFGGALAILVGSPFQLRVEGGVTGIRVPPSTPLILSLSRPFGKAECWGREVIDERKKSRSPVKESGIEERFGLVDYLETEIDRIPSRGRLIFLPSRKRILATGGSILIAPGVESNHG